MPRIYPVCAGDFFSCVSLGSSTVNDIESISGKPSYKSSPKVPAVLAACTATKVENALVFKPLATASTRGPGPRVPGEIRTAFPNDIEALTLHLKCHVINFRYTINPPAPSGRIRTIFSHSMSISNLPSYWENGHGGEPTESPDGYLRGLTVVQREWGLTSVESLAPELLTSFVSKHATNTSFQCSHPTGSVERHGNRTNVVETDMSQEPTTNSVSQRGSACADDERYIRRSEEELRKEPDWRMRFVWRVIEELLEKVECWDCSRMEESWLRIIEGDCNDDDDDPWLWVDGDEKWLTKQEEFHWIQPDPSDWLGARSALRRRVTQRRYPSATARNEKLIVSSKAVAELFASHGRTPPTFNTRDIAHTLRRIIDCECWDAFPSRTDDWTSALTRSKEGGCICSPADCYGMRDWFDMMVWLEGRPPTLVVGNKPCVRCRSFLKSRYEDIAVNCAVTSHVSLLDTLEDYSLRAGITARCDCLIDGHKAFSMRPLGPTARLLVDKNAGTFNEETWMQCAIPPAG
ncbi:hypothetical protein PISMIDRAFT_19375 [Pisolithus microcarpus 441]|uniref:Uncharacterized protein n=1 Tax=Pisolithus microcarpus 441 TaxID=765257 RepID=A0A0C9YUT0_9AGAM|nr:hypothetical protein BKA83DRAFT_19375 [Pisolithus microcarpus]KIK11628.1 hypothetical protein PISMIDRAFT_19375 [Pisolithus microcarpus 441]